MLYALAEFMGFEGGFNLFRYLSFRTGGAVATALLLGMIFGQKFILEMRMRQGKGQPIRLDGPQTHLVKVGTPTMGGLLILAAMTVSLMLWMRFDNVYVWSCFLVTIGFGAIGFMDDYDKVTKASHKGVSGKVRLAFEFLIAGGAAWLILANNGTQLFLPFVMGPVADLGLFMIVVAAVVMVGSGNAVNLTDGLDGLATMPVVIATGTFLLIAYLAGNAIYAGYLGIQHVPGAGELAVFCGAIIGACIAFLWFNAPPAAIFMGDTGSLALGGALGSIAVSVHHEVVLAIVGGLFVIEALSVIIQVFYFKRTGKRVFRMAPIHHHFEQKGWHEVTVVIRFWIVALILALIGLSTLKLR